jgi:hypothetical protein
LVANLFLHHFDDQPLRCLLDHMRQKADLVIACEPRRSTAALVASKLVWVVGCNNVTRHDAIASVRAGFRNRELSALWGAREGWKVEEKEFGLFSHCFSARRDQP